MTKKYNPKSSSPLSSESSDFEEDSVIWRDVELLLIKTVSSSTCEFETDFVRFFACGDADLYVPWTRAARALQMSQFFANDSWCCGLFPCKDEKWREKGEIEQKK